MSWQDRINDSIYLKSPSGQPFRALWTGGERTKSKKLGVFEHPAARGAVVQDLDVGADSYPLTFFFEGPDHDLYAAQFYQACNERGTWEVLHPKDGNLTLQLVTVTEDSQPVSAGNITTIKSEWIEVGIDNPAASIAQIEDDVYLQIEDTAAAAADQFVAKVRVNKPSLLTSINAATSRVLTHAEALKKRIATLQNNISSVRGALLGVTNGVVGGAASLAGAVQSLVTTPGLILRDTAARMDYYEKTLSNATADLMPRVPTAGGVNSAAVHELVATACLGGMAQALAQASFATREEALNYLGRMQTAFLRVTADLDATQALYEYSPVDRQYFSQLGSFTDAAELVRRTRELLLRRSFDLAAAKRITLRRDRAPIEIALTEGVDFDLFIASNGLKGDEILLLPSGRQVVVYL